MAHVDTDGEDGAELVHHGVSLRAWAFVLAGRGDGLALEELLARVDVDEARWQLADDAFNEALLDDAEAGGVFSDALDEAMRDARCGWTRPMPPLDADLRAWLTFYRAWAADEMPLDFLSGRGLRPADVLRLQDFWMARLANDPALREQALEILASAPGRVPEVRPEAPRLITAQADDRPGQTEPLSRRRGGDVLPFVVGEPAPAHPPLSVPLPPPRRIARRMNADETRVARRSDDLGTALPFAAPQDVAEAMCEPAEADGGREPNASVSLAGGDPVAQFTIQRYASLCVDLIGSAGDQENVLRKYEITMLQKAELDAYWTQKMAEDTAIWLAWDRACTECRAANVEPD